MELKRNIKYLNKNFDDFRSQLITYSKTYFPNTYNDFSPASPGMMFMEHASYIGDVLSFYLDNQLQENFLQFSRQDNNLFEMAYMFNYKPKITGLANVNIDFYQLIPTKIDMNGATVPDYDYSLFIGADTIITSNTSIPFIIEDDIDFSVSSSLEPTEVSIAQVSGGEPTYYLLKKTRKAVSGGINTTSFSFGSYQEFPTVELKGNNIAAILDIVDSDGNVWYEVDHLAQELVFNDIKNTNVNDPNNYTNEDDAPYILKTKQVQRRFATRIIDGNTMQLQFGSGQVQDNDEEVTPNPDNVGLGLPFERDKLTTAYSPVNYIFTNTYGIAPVDITLTVRYITGGGVESNVPSNSLTNVNKDLVSFRNTNLNDSTAQYIFDSLSTNNAAAASGGKDGDTIEEIRQNSISNYGSQRRSVTTDDYLLRALSMPSKYGVMAKAFAQKPPTTDSKFTLDLHTLTYDINKNLVKASDTLKRNIKTYLKQYRMIGDLINIKDAFPINIAVDFHLITLPDYNNNDVILRCINEIKSFFNIDRWQINQPIILKDLYILLDKVEGVQTVQDIIITNKSGTTNGYSEYAYDIGGATQNNVIFPSLDPSIFEIKYPDSDIKGKIVSI